MKILSLLFALMLSGVSAMAQSLALDALMMVPEAASSSGPTNWQMYTTSTATNFPMAQYIPFWGPLFTPSANDTITAVGMNVRNFLGSESVVMGLYDSNSNLLASSTNHNSVSGLSGLIWVFPLNYAATNGQYYRLGAVSDTDGYPSLNMGVGNFGTNNFWALQPEVLNLYLPTTITNIQFVYDFVPNWGVLFTGNSTTINTNSAFTAQTAVFDGSTDFMTNYTAQVGLSGGYTWTYDTWVKPYANGGYLFWISDGSLAKFYIQIRSTGNVRFFGASQGGTTKMDSSTSNVLAASTWTHLHVASSRLTGEIHAYFNEVEVTITNSTTFVGNDGAPFDFSPTNPRYSIGASYDGSSKANVALSQTWWSTGMSTNTVAWTDGTGHPKSLGSDGSVPTGTAPKFYFAGSGDSFTNNLGTGGSNFILAGNGLGTEASP